MRRCFEGPWEGHKKQRVKKMGGKLKGGVQGGESEGVARTC